MEYNKDCISSIHWNEISEMLYLDPEIVQGIIGIIRKLERGNSLSKVNGNALLNWETHTLIDRKYAGKVELLHGERPVQF